MNDRDLFTPAGIAPHPYPSLFMCLRSMHWITTEYVNKHQQPNEN